MTTEIDLGRALIGKSKTASASASSLRHGKTTAASSDGYVSVLLDGSDKPVTLKCSGSYRGGQSVTVANDSGTYSIVNDVTISGSGGGSGSDGEDGATFYPSVDSAGNLSWTNDKGLANPATVNIKGDPGEDGIDGKTPTKGVDYFTASDIKEIVDAVEDQVPIYEHPTGSGYRHIPIGGSNGNILRWSADGAASWGAETIYTHPTCLGDPVTGTPGNQAPAFGGSFDVRFPIFNKDGHATDSIDSKVTIPGNTATESANGLMSKDDKKKLGVIDSLVTAIKAIVDNIDVTYVKKQGDGMSGPLRFGQGGSIYGYDEPDGTGSLEFTASKVRQNGAELATKEYADSKAYTHPTGSGYKHIPSGGSSGNILRWSSNGTAAWGAETVYTHPVTSGNKHIPSGGASGKILRWASDGTAKWDSETVYTHPSYDGGVDHSPGNQTPSFGGTFTVRFPHVNSQGHTIFAVDNTVTIPGNTATTSAAGLMSAADKSTLGSLNTTVSSIKPIVDNLDVTYVKKSGGAVSGPLSFGHGANIEGSAATNGASVLNLNASQLLQNGAELATKTYVNGKIPTVPTKVSQLQNDSGFITGAAIPVTPRMFTLWTGSESGKISLNGGAQAIDYEFMDIEYTDGTRYMTQRVYAPNGKSVEISRIVSNGSATYIHSSVLTISGNGITQGNQYQTTLTDSGDTLGISTTSPLKVTRVVGWQIT